MEELQTDGREKLMGDIMEMYRQQQMSAHNDYIRQMMDMQQMNQLGALNPDYRVKVRNDEPTQKEPSQPEPNKLLLLTRRK